MHDAGLPSGRFKRGTAPLYAAPSQTAILDAEEDQISYEFNDDTVPSIPLPNEIPSAPDVEHMSSQTLRSGAVETLIGHNDDLQARLKVNLRRNSILEQQILDLEQQISSLRNQNAALQDRADLVEEIDSVWKAKNEKLSDRFLKLRDEMALSREAQVIVIRNLRALDRYVRRVRRWIIPGARALRETLISERQQLAEISIEIAGRDTQIGRLRTRVDELTRHMHERESTMREDQIKLVDGYETRLQSLEADLKFHRERSVRVDDLTHRQAEAENRAVLFERRYREIEKKFNTDVLDLQTQVSTYRAEAKALAAELETLKASHSRTKALNEVIGKENEGLRDRFESLQALWVETRNKNEALELELLSVDKEKSRKMELISTEGQGASETAVAMATVKAEIDFVELPAKQIPILADQSDRFNKIDVLLARIESGFPLSRSPEASHARGLEIIDEPKEEKPPVFKIAENSLPERSDDSEVSA